MSLIIGAQRSAICPLNGAFSSLSLEALAAPVIADLLETAHVERGEVDELIAGNALGAGGNPARRIALAAQLNDEVAGLSIDRQCVSGLDAILLAKAMILSGQADVVIAGGAESYSRRPWRAHRLLDEKQPRVFYEQAPFTPWAERDPLMHEAADQLAEDCGYAKDALDALAIHSHKSALKAREDGALTAEITPILGQRFDPYSRALTEKHTNKARVLKGVVTAANIAPAADGAAFCLVVSARFYERWRKRGALNDALQIVSGCTLGGDPLMPGRAPINAIQSCIQAADCTLQEITHIELMEAYAAQALACIDGAGLPKDRVNQHGGALARGHPIGASGAVLIARLFHDLKRELCPQKIGPKKIGLAAIAAAGGLGSAIIVRPISSD